MVLDDGGDVGLPTGRMRAKELCLVVDVHLCWRAWLKFARRQRQKREKAAALAAPPPLDAPDETVPVDPPTPPPPTDAPPASPPPPVEPPPPTPPAETPAEPLPLTGTPEDATSKPRPPPKPLRGKACATAAASTPGGTRSTQLPNTTLRGPVGKGGTTRLWELLHPPTQCLVLEFHALDGPRRIPPLVAVDA